MQSTFELHINLSIVLLHHKYNTWHSKLKCNKIYRKNDFIEVNLARYLYKSNIGLENNYIVKNKMLILNWKRKLSEICKNVKINTKMLILTFLYVSENPYVFELKL